MLKIKKYRLERGLKISQLAKLSDVSRPYITQLEQGKYIPTVEVLCKLCKALKVSPNDMIDKKYWE